MTASEKLRVENTSDAAVWVPGGEIEPGKTVTRPESEQLAELLKSKVLVEASEPEPEPKTDRQAKPSEQKK